MSKIFAIAGALFLVIGVISYTAYQGKKLDNLSKAYAEESIKLIVSNWSKEELLIRSSPEMKIAIGNKAKDFDKIFLMFSKLGKLKNLGKLEGEASINYSMKEGRITAASYTTKSNFENSDAEVTVRLIQQYNQWQILSFNVSSPSFLQAANR